MFDEYPDAAPFLAAIREAPDDPTHRLVFSDWLEERGDLRAAWFRDPELWALLAPDVHDPVPPLLARLKSSDWEERSRAGDALKRLGSPVVPAVRAWTLEDPQRYWVTRWVLQEAPPPELRPVEELIPNLASENPVECWLAVVDLGFHGEAAAQAVSALCAVEGYRNAFWGYGDHHDLDEAIIGVLANLGPLAVAAIPYLYDKLDSRANVREAAWETLTKIGPHAPDAMFRHVRTLESDTNPHGAISLLTQVHPEGKAVLARILRGEVNLYNASALVSCVITGEPYGSPAELSDEEAAVLVPALIEALQYEHPDYLTSYNLGSLADALAVIGEPAQPALPILREILTNIQDNPNLDYAREHIGLALARLGDSATSLASLLPGLKDPKQEVRASHIERVAAVARSAPEAIPHVLAGLRDRARSVREKAAEALAELADAESDPTLFAPPLLAVLDDTSATVRRCAVTALGQMKGKRRADFLTRLVMPGHQGPHADAYDTTALVELENQVVAGLIAAVDDPAEEVRVQAVEALHRWEELPPEALEPLLRFVEAGHRDDHRVKALQAMRSAETFPETIVPRLIALFSHQNDGWGQDVAGTAADLLTKVGATAVPALIAALTHTSDRVVGLAIRALDDMGPPAAAAVPHLMPFANDPDPARRAFVIEILGQMQTLDQTLPVLRAALDDPHADARRLATYALARIGEGARLAIPDLLRHTDDPDDSVRHAVVYALGQLEADPADRLPVYRAALKDSYESNRSQALEGLAEMGPVPPALFAEVATLCQDGNEWVRRSAIRAVCHLAPSASEAVPFVRAMLDAPENGVRETAIEAFLALGEAGAEAAPDLYARYGGRAETLSMVFVRTLRTLTRRQLEVLIPEWRAGLASEDEEEAQACARSLRAAGSLGENALHEALNDPGEEVRAMAEYGLALRIED
jgi:uncharacterized protein (TIGR02996 family)